MTVVILVMLAVAPTGWADGLEPVGQLSVPPTYSGLLGGMDVSGPVLGVLGGDGNASVFLEPAAGWGSEPSAATLIDPALPSQPFVEIAVSPSAIVASFEPGVGAYDEVYAEPAGGWQGGIMPSARLLDTRDTDVLGGALIGSPVISGDAVFAQVGGAAPGTVDVFVMPAGGWLGDVTESARLEDSNGWPLQLIAHLGTVVIAQADGPHGMRTDVFTEPAGGWSGTMHQTATLQTDAAPTGSVPATTPVVAVGDRVFAKPTGGWHGAIRPVAELLAEGLKTPPDATVQDGVGLMSGCEHIGTPDQGCETYDWLFDPVDGRWSGTIAAGPVLDGGKVTSYSSPPAPLLLDGHTLLSGALSGKVSIFDIPDAPFGQRFVAGRPVLTERSLTGLGTGYPSLQLRLQVVPYAPAVTSIVLQLPPGLSFDQSDLSAITSKNTSLRARLQGRRLQVSVSGGARVTIDMGPGSLTETRRLILRSKHTPGDRLGTFVGILQAQLRNINGVVTDRQVTLHLTH